MACIICGADTGDACVPVCEEHMGIAELAGRVQFADLSDWDEDETWYGGHVSHVEMMCD